MKKAREEQRKARISALEEQLQAAELEYKAIHKESAAILAKCDQDMQKMTADLVAVQKSELDAFRERWNSEDFLRRYSKPSPQLLNMKAMEKSMVIARMFDMAKRTRKAAVGTERIDTVGRQESALDDMNRERIRILTRHNRESEINITKTAQLREITQREVQRNERPILANIARLKKMITDLKSGSVEPDVRPATALVQPNGHELVSSRTAYKYAAYRRTAQGIKLKIQPLGDVPIAPGSFRRVQLALSGSRN
jgi:hypothetical protein